MVWRPFPAAAALGATWSALPLAAEGFFGFGSGQAPATPPEEEEPELSAASRELLERLTSLRRARNAEAASDGAVRYRRTEALDEAMSVAYGMAKTPDDRVPVSSVSLPRPGNLHSIKSHSWYTAAIAKAQPEMTLPMVEGVVASEWYHPGLTVKPLWCNGDCESKPSLPLAKRLQDNFKAIRREARQFFKSGEVHSYLDGVGKHTTKFDQLIAGNGTWVDIRLWRGRSFDKFLCSRFFRRTCAIIEASPEVWTNPWSHVLISILAPDSWVPFHSGHTNGQLTYHLPLFLPSAGAAELAIVPKPGLFDVGATGADASYQHVEERVHSWNNGKTLVFDDSFSHAVRYRGGTSVPTEASRKLAAVIPHSRVVLLARAWHPELSPAERRGLWHLVRAGGEEVPPARRSRRGFLEEEEDEELGPGRLSKRFADLEDEDRDVDSEDTIVEESSYHFLPIGSKVFEL